MDCSAGLKRQMSVKYINMTIEASLQMLSSLWILIFLLPDTAISQYFTIILFVECVHLVNLAYISQLNDIQLIENPKDLFQTRPRLWPWHWPDPFIPGTPTPEYVYTWLYNHPSDWSTIMLVFLNVFICVWIKYTIDIFDNFSDDNSCTDRTYNYWPKEYLRFKFYK